MAFLSVRGSGQQKIPAAIILVVVGCVATVWTFRPSHSSAQGPGMSSGGDVSATAWRPNRKDAPYVGPQACAKCHVTEAGQHSTAMGRAMETAATSAGF